MSLTKLTMSRVSFCCCLATARYNRHGDSESHCKMKSHLLKLKSFSTKSSKIVARFTNQESKWFTVPNILTFSRMVASPYIGYLVINEQFKWALAFVLIAAASDSVDGWIARNYKSQQSILGSYLDPLADKVMISCLTLSLTFVQIISFPLCSMIVARDVLIVSAAAHFHYKHLPPPKTFSRYFDFENSKVQMEPTKISKYNTFLQLGLVGLSISAPVFGFVDHVLLKAYWCLVASTTVLSGFSYIVKDKSLYRVKR